MQVIRGDDYQSWVYAHHDDLIVVDPWLTNKQVFPGLNWLLHRSASRESYLVKNNLITKVTHIIITAHFSDHLDLESLNKFDKAIFFSSTRYFLSTEKGLKYLFKRYNLGIVETLKERPLSRQISPKNFKDFLLYFHRLTMNFLNPKSSAIFVLKKEEVFE